MMDRFLSSEGDNAVHGLAGGSLCRVVLSDTLTSELQDRAVRPRWPFTASMVFR